MGKKKRQSGSVKSTTKQGRKEYFPKKGRKQQNIPLKKKGLLKTGPQFFCFFLNLKQRKIPLTSGDFTLKANFFQSAGKVQEKVFCFFP